MIRSTRGKGAAAVLAVLAALSGGHAQAAARAPAPADRQALEGQLLASMQVLASDEFAGREPGTPGETKALRWLAGAWFKAGLVSGTNDPGHPWFAPVTLIARAPEVSQARFARHGRALAVAGDQVLVLTSARRSLVRAAPLYFVGHGQSVPPRAELAGRVAVLLDSPPPAGPPPASPRARQLDLLGGGALAVLTVLDGARGLAEVRAALSASRYVLAAQAGEGDMEAFVTPDALRGLLAGGAAGDPLAALRAEADRRDFQPHLLDIEASLEAANRETSVRTHNLIGRLPGRHPAAGTVLLLAHWDHFGLCAGPEAPHRICNGAIDNASGLAAITEVARRLASQPRPERDILFLATTAEETGLLGAEAFAENPPLPLDHIVAALNLDSLAIAPAGTPLGIVGKGMTPLDAPIKAVAAAAHMAVSDSAAPNAYLRRQDGWALMRHDVPAVMVTSAYGDIARLERYFASDYHSPRDVVKPGLELGGMVGDVLFHVDLAQYLADPRRYGPPARLSP